MLDFTYNVSVFNKNYEVREISFLEYRNFVKSNVDTDLQFTDVLFEKLLKTVLVTPQPDINILTKFLILLKVRSTIIGQSIEFNLEDRQIAYPVDFIFEKFNNPYEKFVYELDGVFYTFDLPSSLYPKTELFERVYDCLHGVGDLILTKDVKVEVFDNLPGLPVSDIHNKLMEHFNNTKYTLERIDYTLTPLDSSFLTFLKSVFNSDLKGLYDIEYSLRRNLNFSSLDFDKLSYPECNILLRTFAEEMSQADKKGNEVENSSQTDN